MINKKSLWFLTLFSLILILSIYYVTMPSELLLTNNENYTNDEALVDNNDSEPTVTVEESEILVALRIESDEKLESKLDELKVILTNKDSTIEQKNEAFEMMKSLNNLRAEEQSLEQKILSEHNLKAFVKIDGDQIRVTVDKKEHDTTLANNIMRSIQSNYDKKMYITVKFQS